MVGFCLGDRVHGDPSGHFCKRVICRYCQEARCEYGDLFSHFPLLSLHPLQPSCASRQIQLYLCILLSRLMFVKQRNTGNNSEKVLAIRLHDNSNMSAPEPTVKGALLIIYRLAVLMSLFAFVFFFLFVFCFMISQLSIAKEGWKSGKGEKKK